MDPSRLAAIDALFEEALDLPPEARPALLEARTAGDPGLRSEVEALLARSDRSVRSLLDPVRAYAAAVPQPGADELAPGEVVGAWRLLRRLGEGGMGVVWLAERIDGSFERQVALKLLPAAGVDGEHVRRFELERRILARFEHPRIARLLDGGVDRRGLPYLVMEHVEGLPIDRHCDERRLSIDERIARLAEVADAVQAAHRSLIVHRDLKPSNVLVSDAGQVKLLDFGIAKILDPERGGGELTVAEKRAMTPTYASPEQVNGEPVSTASDVYQLGLLLYELLTGLKPQAASTGSLSELVEIVCRREPPPPSRAVLEGGEGGDESVKRAEARGTTPAKLSRRLRGELDAIVARAVAKRPAERYPTPSDLAADLERFLEGRPVVARRASLAFRARKWVARNAAVAALGAAVALAVVGYAVTVTVQSRAIDRQRLRAEREAATASSVERFLVELFEVSDPETANGRDVTARELLDRGLARIEEELADQPAVQARLWSALGRIENSLGDGDAGRALLSRALESQRALAGERSLDVAETRLRLGMALRGYGDRAAGEKDLELALALFRELLPPGEPRIATALAELGVTKALRGEFAGAERDLQASLALRRATGNRAEIADGLRDLGFLEQQRREPRAAERYFREALVEFRAIYGERHATIANLLSHLGMLRRAERDFPAAMELFKEAEAMNRAIYGERHVEVGRNLNQLAMVHQQIGELERSDELYGRSLAILEPQLTPDNPAVIETRQGLGALRVKQRRFAEGEALLREAVAAWLRKGSGPSYLNSRLALLWYGRSLDGQGRSREAVEAWKEGLAISPELDDNVAERLRAEVAAKDAAQAGAGDSSAR